MKKNKAVALIVLLIIGVPVFAAINESFLVKYNDLTATEKVYNIDIRPYIYKFNNLTLNGYKYIDTSSEQDAKIIVPKGTKLTINVKNSTGLNMTNIHWHGLRVPNSEDGPKIAIKNGETFTYQFTVKDSGTYWYHSHARPVRDQVDNGMFGLLIVLDPAEKVYSQDLYFMLDDVGGRLGKRHMHMMEVIGDIKTINGVEYTKFPAVELIKGERLKLRFLNVSTAEYQNLSISKHDFIVTHLDGAPLEKSYLTKEITLTPGQRVEAELVANKSDDIIRNSTGSQIKLNYIKGEVKTPPSPFIPNQNKKLVDAKDFKPDRTIVLDSGMGKMMRGMVWTIDGKEYPNVEPIQAKQGKVYYLRIVNNDTRHMHPMDHPMHLHGTHFQVVSVNGIAPKITEFRDTINVPAGGYVDIAFKIDEKGQWMLHCHILDHEDGGMMMYVDVQ